MKKWISVHGRTAVRFGTVMRLCGYAIISIASIPAISAINLNLNPKDNLNQQPKT